VLSWQVQSGAVTVASQMECGHFIEEGEWKKEEEEEGME
jgi:hypothetical protein